MPLVATMSRNSLRPRSSPNWSITAPNQSVSSTSMPSLPFHLGSTQVIVALRQFILLDELGVVGGDEDVVPRSRPFAVRRERRRIEVGQARRFHLLEQLFPVQRFHRRAARLEHIRVVPAAAGLGHAALDHIFGAAAPHPHLDAVFFLEGGGHDRHVVDIRRRIDRDGPFLLRAGDQLFGPIRARIGRDIRGGRERAPAPMRSRWAAPEGPPARKPRSTPSRPADMPSRFSGASCNRRNSIKLRRGRKGKSLQKPRPPCARPGIMPPSAADWRVPPGTPRPCAARAHAWRALRRTSDAPRRPRRHSRSAFRPAAG